jgi:hypothetical protein
MSYKAALEKAAETKDEVIVIDRAGASSLNGTVHSVDDSGVTLKSSGGAENAAFTYIEFTSIRGITTTDWDMDAIAN